jgi:RsiW-degrading membrane proteinase PrsW (M82 family)
MDNTVMFYIISGILALIPTIIWLGFILNKSKRTSIQILIFALSIFSVVPVFILHYFLDIFPQLDIVRVLEARIQDQSLNFVILFIFVGIVEEIAKQIIIRVIDKKYLLIQTVNESIHYSIIAALGFAFFENILYIYAIYTSFGIEQLIIPYLFRSIFTTSAHIIFSGVFGYYYGISKFSINIIAQSKWVGKKQRISNMLSRMLGISRIQGFKEYTVIKGLFVAMTMHAVFNFFLQFNQIPLVILFISLSSLILFNKLKQKAGKLILVSDPTEERRSSMPKNDEDVVVELLGMWFKEKRYVDVLHICERLMERDPDNKVIQLFKAKALDEIDSKSAYGQILKNVFPKKKKKTIAGMLKEKIARKEKVKEPQAMKEPEIFTGQKGSKEDASDVFKLDV